MPATGPVTFLEPRHDHDLAGRCEDCGPVCRCRCHEDDAVSSGEPSLALRRLVVERMNGERIDVLERSDFDAPPPPAPDEPPRLLDRYA